MAMGDLGWELSGSARAVLDAAGRRAALWLLPEDDFCKGAFVRGHAGPPSSWARASLEVLRLWQAPDWPEWAGGRAAAAEGLCEMREGLSG